MCDGEADGREIVLSGSVFGDIDVPLKDPPHDTPLQVSGLASQTWRGVPAPPSRSEVCGWPDVLPPPRYHMHILEARNPYHRVIFVHLS